MFVFCGMCQAEKNSIECLDLDSKLKGWTLILIDISPRSYLSAQTLGKNGEIVLLGGMQDKPLREVATFDVKSLSIRSV